MAYANKGFCRSGRLPLAPRQRDSPFGGVGSRVRQLRNRAADQIGSASTKIISASTAGSARPEFSGESPVHCTRDPASRSEQPSRGELGKQRTEDRPWDVGQRSYTDDQKALSSDACNKAPWRQVMRRRHVTPPTDQALEKKNREQARDPCPGDGREFR
jgi:hypothetical protein